MKKEIWLNYRDFEIFNSFTKIKICNLIPQEFKIDIKECY